MPPPGADGFEPNLAILAGVALLVGHDHSGYLERVPDSLPGVTGGPFVKGGGIVDHCGGRKVYHLA